nr:MAG TPA: hypothetical protein [Caudoviricetes sp.]DAQ49265.1 MAG TPA: hypothetical protein [Caudoviricetes sp.]
MCFKKDYLLRISPFFDPVGRGPVGNYMLSG